MLLNDNVRSEFRNSGDDGIWGGRTRTWEWKGDGEGKEGKALGERRWRGNTRSKTNTSESQTGGEDALCVWDVHFLLILGV